MSKSTDVDYNPFSENEISKIALTNDSQREIWVACILGGDNASRSYNESISIEFKGPFQVEHFRASLVKLVERHESLRSTISADGETWMVYQQASCSLTELQLTDKNEVEQHQLVQEFIHQEMNTTFNLHKGPLFRFFLHTLSEEKVLFTLFIHHIIGDGWSLGVLVEELSKLYEAACTQATVSLAPPAQISTYSIEKRAFKNTESYQSIKTYWSAKLKQQTFQMDLPQDIKRQEPRSYASKRLDFQLPEESLLKLKKLAHSLQVGLVSILLSTFELFLKKVTRDSTTLVGLPTSGQLARGSFDLIGHCVNFLPIISTLEEQESAIQYVIRRKNELLNDLDHQEITISEIVKELNIPRLRNYRPLISVIFNVDPSKDKGVTFHELQHRVISNPRNFENADIFLNLSENEKFFQCEWQYNTDIFTETSIEQYHHRYMEEIDNLIANPNHKISLHSWQKEDRPIPATVVSPVLSINPSLGLVHQFEEKVHAFSAETALRFENEFFTYQSLNEAINRLAHHLKNKGIGTGDKVLLTTDRASEVIIAMMALLKLGAVFVPVDAKFPADRVQLMLDNIQPALILSSRKYSNKRMTERNDDYFIEDLLIAAKTASVLNLPLVHPLNRSIYILHTSGSTGVPKGVTMNEDALINIFIWQIEDSAMDHRHRTLQYSALNFDVSFQEIFATFFTGGTLVLINDRTRLDPALLLAYLNTYKINRIYFPFVALQSLVEYADAQHTFPTHLLDVITAGEQLKITPQVRRFFKALPHCSLYNHYGPTETHIVTSLKLTGQPDQWPALPSIGKEITNTEHFILNDQLMETPSGEIGELYLGGVCLAEGYYNQPELTAKSFIRWQHPEKGNLRIYRSGDLARRLPDGTIEFLGRVDHQVKIRGFRVELSEIEYYLNQLAEVRQSVMIAQTSPDQLYTRLVAYLLVDSRACSTAEHIPWKERWDVWYTDARRQQKTNPQLSLDEMVSRQLGPIEEANKHAQESLTETLARINHTINFSLPETNLKILDIGCGAGHLLYPLQKRCDVYYASDRSTIAIQNIHEKIQNSQEGTSHVILAACDGKDVDFLKGDKVDLIIINSVIQYFDSLEYLEELIETSIHQLTDRGCLFIGDVHAKETLEIGVSADQFNQVNKNITIEEYREMIGSRLATDDELVVDPSYFFELNQKIAGITHVEVQLRKGDDRNRTTKYHYDVWLYKDSSLTFSRPDHVFDWKDIQSVGALTDLFNRHQNESFHIHSIFNERCSMDMRLFKALQSLAPSTRLSDIQFTETTPLPDGDPPTMFWELGERHAFNTHARWMTTGIDNRYEVFFIPKNTFVSACPPLQQPSALGASNVTEELPVQVLKNEDLKIDFNAWKIHLKSKLPEYMIPDQFVILDRLPLTSTGKVDRKKLPAVALAHMPTGREFVEPKNEVEVFLVALWSKLLSLKKVSTTADFFDIGGHSLLAVKVILAIDKKYGIKIPLAAFFDHSSIVDFANRIHAEQFAAEPALMEEQPVAPERANKDLDTAEPIVPEPQENGNRSSFVPGNPPLHHSKSQNGWNALVPIKRTGKNLPVYMVHGAGLNVLIFKSFVRYMDAQQPIFGLQALGQNGHSKPVDDIQEIARLYVEDILRNDSEGPYILGGYSYGGFLAVEMARRLIALGKEVKMLAIFDTYSDEVDTKKTTPKEVLKKTLFTLSTMFRTPNRYFSHQLLLGRIKVKSLFGNNNIANVEAFSFDKEIINLYKHAFVHYKLEPLDLDIHLFRAKNSLTYYPDKKYMGWKSVVKHVHTYDIPGDHKTIFFSPHDKGLAKIFQEALQKMNH